MTALTTVTLNDRYTAEVDVTRYGTDRPVIVVRQDGHRTPGQWFASTIASRPNPHAPLDIDSGARWTLDAECATKLYAFAIQTLVDNGLL